MWFTHVNEHSNHKLNDGWSLLTLCIPVCKPLDNNHGVHETEKCHQQGNLSENNEDEFNPVTVVDSVHTFKDGTHGHLPNTKNDRSLHFETVEISDLLFAAVPNWVNTEFVYAVLDDTERITPLALRL